jgi:hypothetical protein
MHDQLRLSDPLDQQRRLDRGLPNPNPDGIWFHIGVWDPNDPAEANSQINTQPVMPPWWIGE